MQEGRHRKLGRRVPVGLILGVAALLLLAAVFRHKSTGTEPRAATEAAPKVPASVATQSELPGVFATALASTPTVAISPPIHLSIASIGVSTALQPLGLLADGTLQSPSQWAVAGWYCGGVYPGHIGPAVIAGHIDSTNGPAVFYRLRDLVAGATVAVTEQNGTVLSFVVDSLQSFPKDEFPAEAVYGPRPDAELRLVTCTGEFDRATHNYLSNLVVSAHLTSS